MGTFKAGYIVFTVPEFVYISAAQKSVPSVIKAALVTLVKKICRTE